MTVTRDHTWAEVAEDNLTHDPDALHRAWEPDPSDVMWRQHVQALVDRLTSPVDERTDSEGYYFARHFRSPISLGARSRHAAEQAERAVIVLAATDDLPASRLLYSLLLKAGALR